MKKIIFVLALVTGSIGFKAQAQVSVNVNIGAQPLWGPVGYDRVDYYYMPDIDAYYSVPRRQFVYLEGPNWVFTRALPARYSSYDLYHGYKVVVNEPNPWVRHNVYKVKYANYRGNRGQAFIRDSKEPKYYKVKGHPNYVKVKNGNGNGKGNNGNGRGNGGGKKGGGHGKH